MSEGGYKVPTELVPALLETLETGRSISTTVYMEAPLTDAKMRRPEIYEVIDGKKCSIEQPDGIRVEECYSYGCDHDDSERTGVEHAGVRVFGTNGPFFTTPTDNLRRVA